MNESKRIEMGNQRQIFQFHMLYMRLISAALSNSPGVAELDGKVRRLLVEVANGEVTLSESPADSPTQQTPQMLQFAQRVFGGTPAKACAAAHNSCIGNDRQSAREIAIALQPLFTDGLPLVQ